MKLLAVDPATLSGWAIFDSSTNQTTFGTYKISKKTNESEGFKWLRFEQWLRQLQAEHIFKFLCYEMPVTMHAGATIHHSKLVAIIEKFCAESGIEFVVVTPSELKKFATGKGNAKKEQMIASACELGFETSEPNEADAIHILQYLKSKLL